ncbi:hypothetical protein ACOCG7_34120 (plasmid) [Paraburkholderia sp. DD10]|uniref:hypothetical protein n=1 Tax=Paraburkholderia sp. DD10 TaxID=3409691 RepID=UPI003BA0CE43
MTLGSIDIASVRLPTRRASAGQPDAGSLLHVVIEGDPARNRAIKIGDYPSIPCGGVHVANLSEIAVSTIKSIKAKGGRLRIGYDAVGVQ